ncbi:MAG: phage holin family protein, partial [Bacilli bacterium]|nr:phage holin family protein [Bacilli bacterium]
MKDKKSKNQPAKPEFSTSAYYAEAQKKRLWKVTLFKIIRSASFFVGLIFAIFGLLAILGSPSTIWPLIVGGIFILVGIVFSFLVKPAMKQSIAGAKKDFADFYKLYEAKNPVELQESKRAFAYMDHNNGEIYVYQDLTLCFKVNKSDIASANFAPELSNKKERIGRYPIYLPFMIKCTNGDQHVITLVNTSSTDNMYEPESTKKFAAAAYEANTKRLQDFKKMMSEPVMMSAFSHTEEDLKIKQAEAAKAAHAPEPTKSASAPIPAPAPIPPQETKKPLFGHQTKGTPPAPAPVKSAPAPAPIPPQETKKPLFGRQPKEAAPIVKETK